MSISIRIIYFLVIVFIPNSTRAESSDYFLQNLTQTTLQPLVFAIAKDPACIPVANIHNIQQDKLIYPTWYYDFTCIFDHRQLGNKFNISGTFLSESYLNKTPTALTVENQNHNIQEWKFANYALLASSFLASGNITNAFTIARGIASGAASNIIQQWLSHFYTARIQLDVDKHFSMKNSQLELLIPLYKQNNGLIFTQGNIHRIDNQATSTLGLGYRQVSGSWIFGINTFLDYNQSLGSARLSFGGESWYDFLKISINSYYRINNWKSLLDFNNYEKRPANGWDIRMEARVCSLPELNGKLMYQQYYGDQVALFGWNNKQKNPHTIMVSINYTPIPILTFGIERYQGQRGRSNTQFKINMNYQLDLPWQKQINPNTSTTMYSLVNPNSLYNLVERNDNIIFQYLKKKAVHLKITGLLMGYAGEQKSLHVVVTSKYGLEHINWSASSLIAAGGSIIQNNGDWTVVMPRYHSGIASINNYVISCIAVDKKGNISNRAETQITVIPAITDMGVSSLCPSSIMLPADGISQQQLILKINDKYGYPVDIPVNEISFEKKNKIHVHGNSILSRFTRRSVGEYVMTIKAGTIPESFIVTPLARNMHFASTSIMLSVNHTTALVKAIDIIKDHAIADGKSPNIFKITVVDAQNNLIPSQVVNLKANNNATLIETVITEEDGTVVVPVVSVHAGQTIITSSINNRDWKTLKLTFQPDKNTASIKQKDFNILPEISFADGKMQKIITAKITDANGNTVPYMPVIFSVNNRAILSQSILKSDIEGHVTTTLNGTVAGISQVTATVNNITTTKDTIFTSNEPITTITSVSTESISGIADGITTVIFKAQINDYNKQPLSGVLVKWKSNSDNTVSFSHKQTFTSSNGIAETAVTNTQATNNIVITASTNVDSKSSSPFTFIADKKHPVITTLNSNKKILTANGIEEALLSISVADINGNPISGMEVIISSDDNRIIIIPSYPVTNKIGMAVVAITTKYAGKLNISASLNKVEKKTLSIQAIADEQTANISIATETKSATVGQLSPITLIATVIDANSNPITGISVAWQTNYNQLSNTISRTNFKGEAIIQLTGTQAIITTVTAILYNGHKDSIQITFWPGDPVIENSQLSVSPTSITANGRCKAFVSVILRDKWNNLVPKKTVNWSADTNAGIQFNSIKNDGGLYQASVIGISEGVWSLSAKIDSISLETQLTLLAYQSSAHITSLKVSGSSVARANGQETIIIRAQVKDKNSNTKLKGVAIGWNTNLGILSSRLNFTDENGEAEIILRSLTAGTAQVSAMLGGGTLVKVNSLINFTNEEVNIDKSSFSISSSSIVIGEEGATLNVIARDLDGKLLTGLKDKIFVYFLPNINIDVSSFNEVSLGVYKAIIVGKTAGITQVNVIINGNHINHNTMLTFIDNSYPIILKKGICVNSDSMVVGSTVTYSAELSDAKGNTLGAGIPVTWNANIDSILESQITYTNDFGVTSVNLTRKKEGTARVNLFLPLHTISAPNVIFNAGDIDETHSELILSPLIIMAGKKTATLTLILHDHYDNPIRGQLVRGISSNSNNVYISEAQENNNMPGQYTMTVSSSMAGDIILYAKINNQILNKKQILTVTRNIDNYKLSTIIPDKLSLIAGDEKGVTYKTIVTDIYGNLLSNILVSWCLNGKAESYEHTSRTNEQGVATVTVRSNTSGLLKMTAYLETGYHIQASTVTVIASNIKHITFTADKTSILSNGIDRVTIIVTLKDDYENPVIGKTITIYSTKLLSGFNLGSIKDQQNGNYVVQGTAIKKGQAILSMQVNGKKMGNPITINIEGMTPYLRFANLIQFTSWTSNYTASQAVIGMPPNMQQLWSTTNPNVATVDISSGKVTLLKAGETTITVLMPGNQQYNSATASYTLKVIKVDPGLKSGNGGGWEPKCNLGG